MAEGVGRTTPEHQGWFGQPLGFSFIGGHWQLFDRKNTKHSIKFVSKLCVTVPW